MSKSDRFAAEFERWFKTCNLGRNTIAIFKQPAFRNIEKKTVRHVSNDSETPELNKAVPGFYGINAVDATIQGRKQF